MEQRQNIDPMVAIVMGSKTDSRAMMHCKSILDELEIPCRAQVISAHRTPDETANFAKEAHARGIKLIIAGAGAAAALPGCVAAHTHLPVIGVPLNTTSLGGLDSLLAIAQMPSGVPVATTGIGEAGAKNAALMAARILALAHPIIETRLLRYQERVYALAKENCAKDPFAP